MRVPGPCSAGGEGDASGKIEANSGALNVLHVNGVRCKMQRGAE